MGKIITNTLCTTLFLVLVGCVGVKPRVVPLTASYDREFAEKQLQPGKNRIEGNAFMRQSGGGVVTCAGNGVKLIPVTEYATQRAVTYFGNDQGGFLSVAAGKVQFEPDFPEYIQNQKTTMCDSQGRFEFENIADGEYYVTAVVVWQVGYDAQGGALLKRVRLNGGKTGQTEKIIMSR